MLATLPKAPKLQDSIIAVALSKSGDLYEIAVDLDGHQALLAGSTRVDEETGEPDVFSLPANIPVAFERVKKQSTPELVEFAKKTFRIPPTKEWNKGYGFGS